MLARLALLAALGLSVTACSSLTRPEEISIAAEPLPAQNAPGALPAGLQGADRAMPAPRAGGG